MKKIAQGIVRFRKLILTVAFLLLIPSAIGAVATRINYDILTYLPQDLDSMIGEVALEDDFHLASTGMITVEGLPTNELIAMKKDIEAVPGVMQTFWLSDVIDPSIPTEMLPADVQQFMFGKNDSTMLIVRFDAPSASDETMNAVSQIETLLRKDCFFGGMSVILQAVSYTHLDVYKRQGLDGMLDLFFGAFDVHNSFPLVSGVVQVTVQVVLFGQRVGKSAGRAGRRTGKFFFVQHHFHSPGRHIGVVEPLS